MLFLNRILSLCLSSILLIGCTSIERLAIPSSTLKHQNLSNTGSQTIVNHEIWNNFLAQYTQKDAQGVNRVSYGTVTPQDHRLLKEYIQNLSSTNVTLLSRNAQLAFWANIYNALTVDVILDHYPVHSIRNIKDSFFDLGPWENKRLIIAGKNLSLHDIEHGIVRPLWSDTPEIHYIFNCAAAGCPNLSSQAFQSENILETMNAAAVDFVNNARGVVVFDDGSVAVSKIYSWYIDDFGGSQQSILNHIKRYAKDDLKKSLSNVNVIQHYFYDWSLNDTKLSNQLITSKNKKAVIYN